MSKKKKKKGTKSHQDGPRGMPPIESVDVIEGSGFRMERHGRFIHMETNRTDEEQQELMEKMAASAESLTADIAEHAASIIKRLSKYDTFTILNALTLQNYIADPDTYKEYSHPGKPFVPEYATLLALQHPYSEGTNEKISLNVLQEIQAYIEHIFRTAAFLNIARYAKKSIEEGTASQCPDTLEEMQSSIRMHELVVRNPAYDHHHHEVIRGLFRPFEKDPLFVDGLSVNDALVLSNAITARINRLLNEKFQDAQEGLQLIKSNVRKARHIGTDDVVDTANGQKTMTGKAFYQNLTKLSSKEFEQALKTISLEWIFNVWGTICSFIADELADEASIPLKKVEAYLNLFSMTFGDIPESDIEPSQTHPLRTRPLVRYGNRYLSSAPALMDWAIQPAFESTLKAAGGSWWQRYHKHRHDHVLHLTCQLLQRMMPGATIYTNLLYYEDGDTSKEAEIDVIVIYDTVVFLVEVKGADVTDPARRGAPDRLRYDLEKVIAESHIQALRAKTYITANENPAFRPVAGGPDLNIPDGIRNIVMMSVSLAPLGHLTSLLHADSDIGFFKDGEYSWIISLYDLMVIGDVIDLPPMFPHYVIRRIHTAHQSILEAHDELDIFGYYLNEGLYIDDIVEDLSTEKRMTGMSLLSYTGQFDEYYAYQNGSRRKHAKKPAQRIHPKLRKIIDRIELSGLPGRVDVAMSILDLSHEARMGFLNGVKKAQKICKRKHRSSDATLTGDEEGGWGLTYICAQDSVILKGALERYCIRKQQQLQYKKWVGIAEVIGRKPKLISVFQNQRY
ncbi:MAG: NERD domain-containing protein [Desulfobacteraceae bacterium]|nr:hypothetical protein [Desulfobacteraceae bacterium]MBC2755703.1 NERD domain-containing protein [Desulfobacteraceae bacterium]